MLRRFVLLGDIHGEVEALEATLERLPTLGRLDAILCTGDVPGKHGAGDTKRCVELLKKYGVRTIRGNHDRWAVHGRDIGVVVGQGEMLPAETLAFLEDLPVTLTFETPRGRLLLCHGVGTNDMAGIYPGGDAEEIQRVLKTAGIYDNYGVLVSGHTHRQMVKTFGEVLYINAGTLLLTDSPCFSLIDFDARTLEYFLPPHLDPQGRVLETFPLLFPRS